MPTFVLLATLTEDGFKAVGADPNNVDGIARDLEDWEVRVLHNWAVLGPYDFAYVVEAPDNRAVAQASVQISSHGIVRLLTLPAISMEDFASDFAGRPES